MKNLYHLILWPIFFISQLLSLSLISWHLLAQLHFAYPLGYQLLNLETHIAQYAPLNRHKEDFEFSSKEEHWRLFGEISDAIQNHGKGLADIQYTLSNGNTTSLMHQDEIIHLQDVANLVDRFYQLGYVSIAIWIACLLIIGWKKTLIPSNKKVVVGFIALISAISLLVISLGAKEVFYWLHVKIFPADHKWFFYYQDSLMTTLMKAPDIFAFITVLLVFNLLILWCALTFLLTKRIARSYKTT